MMVPLKKLTGDHNRFGPQDPQRFYQVILQ
jgi:hypothetical protein